MKISCKISWKSVSLTTRNKTARNKIIKVESNGTSVHIHFFPDVDKKLSSKMAKQKQHNPQLISVVLISYQHLGLSKNW